VLLYCGETMKLDEVRLGMRVSFYGAGQIWEGEVTAIDGDKLTIHLGGKTYARVWVSECSKTLEEL
jgi:hypothetical protein